MRLTLFLCLPLLIAGCALTPADDGQETLPNTAANKFWRHLDRTPGMLGDLGFMTYCVGRDQPLRVLDDGAVLDWRDVLAISGGCVEGWRNITPDTCEGTGFLLDGRKGVTVRGVPHRSFKVGIYAKNCDNLVIDGCKFEDMFRQRLHSTPDREDARDWLWPHNNDNREWMTNYGACIVLENCKNCVIRSCSARGTQNGIILDKCEGCQVYNNDFSYCSGWGCALWRSNKNTVAQNRFDYCVRGYGHGVYARGQDSAGILVFEQCCDNTFAYNSATHGGDGFFLYAGHETTQRTGKGGCNRNLVYGNDFSYAVANGIEATFSDGNVFAKNKLVGCDYGIWGGYSYNTLISQNEIADSLTAGVAIEHGHDNWIEDNRVRGKGIRLWADENKDFDYGIYGKNKNTRNERNTLRRNSLEGYIMLNIFNGSEFAVEDNEFIYDPHASGTTPYSGFLRIGGIVKNVTFARNNIGCLIVHEKDLDAQSAKLTFAENYVSEFSEPLPSYCHGSRDTWPHKPYNISSVVIARPVTAPKGVQGPTGLEPLWLGGGGDRNTMVVGPWGPVNAQVPQQLDFGALGASEAVFWFSGPEDTPFRISAPDKGILEMEFTLAERQIGRVTEFRITPIRSGFADYAFTVKCNAHREGRAKATKDFVLRGTILGLSWNVSFWQWTPAKGSELPPDWDKLIASPPLKTFSKPALAYNNQGGAPEDGVPADHFATVATTEIELPAGSWKLVLTSDDGARLFVDGEKVIERWDIHGPTDDVYTLKFEKPRLVKLRVEHFENTGWAALALRIERK